MSFRRLRVLLERLPPESATMTAIRNAAPALPKPGDLAKAPWSALEVLIGTLVNEHRLWRYEQTLRNLPKGQKKPDEPELLRMPGDDKAKNSKGRPRAPLTLDQADWLFRHINGLN
ncbi:hypothetical protein [Actinomadura decatromicini]|uniref:Uncharacterized protein n=1 Tax=Actinomadura decatromicini TaxID=2604572 RepID=A0A5D3FB73_9ACTN|nr:hypothetical protein [Actinomadura decatromicini]TYK45154.1 hypothetical protein FXF68_31225 [Actinomadura decatromicini]